MNTDITTKILNFLNFTFISMMQQIVWDNIIRTVDNAHKLNLDVTPLCT